MQKNLKSLFRTVATFGLRHGTVAYATRAASRFTPESMRKPKALRLRGLPHPIVLRPGTTDWMVLDQVFISREYDCPSPAHAQALDQYYHDLLARSETPLIIDCGANIGLASIFYATKFPRARIIAVEPEPENFAILQANSKNYPSIIPVHAGISDHETRMSLSNQGDAAWAWQTTENVAGQISTRTIPGLTATVPDARLMIVKIDIEGSEVALFRSNAEWAAETPLIVFEAHDTLFHWRGTFHAVASVLTREPRDYLQNGENTFAFAHAMQTERPSVKAAAARPSKHFQTV